MTRAPVDLGSGTVLDLGVRFLGHRGGAIIDAADGARDDAMTADDAPDASDAPIDAMPDSMTTPVGWSTPELLGISNVDDPTLTGDLLQIWFDQGGDIYHASRASVFVAFGLATEVTELSTLAAETTPEVSADGTVMLFARNFGTIDVYISTWDPGTQAWSVPVPIDDINTLDHETAASMSTDGRMLAFARSSPVGTADIYISTRAQVADPWGTPVAATELNSNTHDGSPFLTGDKLTLCFDSLRASVQHDIYCATRSSPALPFDAPVAITAINSAQSDQDPWLSPDGKLLIFWSDRDGTGRLYFSRRP
ncbi:MAG: hypothetical protein ACKV2T_13985 [Kofleriaceae bacterium]